MGYYVDVEPMHFPILLFDGVCGLCNRTVRFVLAWDRRRIFRFAALQSETGTLLLSRFGLQDSDLTTMALLDNGRAFTESDAVLRTLRLLGFPWSLLWPLVLTPKSLRDPVYRWVARNRYRWFGKLDQCPWPGAEVEGRFLDSRNCLTP